MCTCIIEDGLVGRDGMRIAGQADELDLGQ